MRSFVSLNKNRDFIRAYKKGRSAVTPCIALYSMKNRQQTNRIGITASKRIGRAVQRNRAKRVIREALMMLKPQLKPGYDLVVVARSRTPYRKTPGRLRRPAAGRIAAAPAARHAGGRRRAVPG